MSSLTASELASLVRAEPQLANEIVLTDTPDGFELTVDGEQFPWLIARGVSTHVSPDECPQVHLTLLAKSVRVEHRARFVASAETGE